MREAAVVGFGRWIRSGNPHNLIGRDEIGALDAAE
jgi:hypothetical protein